MAPDESMRRAARVLPAGSWDAATASDELELAYDERHRRRFRYLAQGGTDFLLDLPRVAVLNDGDGLALDDGRIVRVIAAAEALTEVRAADAQALLRLAWHIGNRHLPAQLLEGHILIREDHVITAMLQGLGAQVRPLRAPFTPESGAYAGAHAPGGEPGSHGYVFSGSGHGH